MKLENAELKNIERIVAISKAAFSKLYGGETDVQRNAALQAANQR